jgi:hypothetical protein
MGGLRVRVVGPARLVTIGAAVGLIAAGLALGGSNPLGGPTFRDVVYSHHVTLTGVVVGKGTFNAGKPLTGTVISIRKGKKKVGKWTGAEKCAGFGAGAQCNWDGTGKMKIGTIKGKVSIHIGCEHVQYAPGVGVIDHAGTPPPPGEEGLRIHNKHCPPSVKGTKFKFTLSY